MDAMLALAQLLLGIYLRIPAMRAVQVWQDHVKDPSTKGSQTIYSLAFKPDGEQLIVAAGSKVLVYDATSTSGHLLRTLTGHRDTVYCVAFAYNGELFASGGADKTVILWNNSLEGMLKFMHTDVIQCLAFNPVSHHLLSCSISELGIWSSDQKAVNKCKLVARATCCSWTSDGQYFAVGMQNGSVSIRNKATEEKAKVDRPGGSPVWCLTWNPTKDESYDILCVCDWNQKLSFYQLSGKQIGKEKSLLYDPCCISQYLGGDYLLIGGSNRKLSLYSRDGVLLGVVADVDSLVWCVQAKPGQTFIATGCEDGSLVYVHLVFNTVHGLYKERYAYRENMTDVVVQHLLTDQKVKIKCRDLVKKIAVYKSRLAVQLPEKIVIYELYGSDATDMQYRVRDRIPQRIECTLLVVCTSHVVLCQDKKLMCMTLSGEREREWQMESLIRYIKVTGGPPGREGLLVGLRDGQVYQIFLDNSFPVLLLQHKAAVRCLDLSASRNKLAIVDENSTCIVYDTQSKDILFQEPNANSVAWNTLYEDMLCFTGGGFVSVKANNFPIHQQRQAGFVVGYHGSKIFCLNYSSIFKVDVPQSTPMLQYLERKMFQSAYNVACLGVTENDWMVLAMEAFETLNVDIARKALMRIKRLPHLAQLQSIEERKKQGVDNEQVYLADVMAYQGKFEEAAKLYNQSGQASKAVDMYTDLRRFELAKKFMGSESVSETARDLMKKQAEWCEASKDPKSACDMYLAAGEFFKAADVMIENGWVDRLLLMTRNPAESSPELLKYSVQLFLSVGQAWDKFEAKLQILSTVHRFVLTFAAEVLQKLGDWEGLVNMYIGAQQWEEAFHILESHPDLKGNVYVPYAMWLLENDRFNEAQDALNQAGRQSEAIGLLKQLASNAVVECRFDDAAYYNWLMAASHKKRAKEVSDVGESAKAVTKMWHHIECAVLYYAYSGVQKFTDQPFTSHLPEALFNMARFLYHSLMKLQPAGISKVYTLFTLARQSKSLGAYKLARYASDKLQSFIIPPRLQEQVDMGSLTIRAKPFEDKEDLLPVCYRCSVTNPLLNSSGLQCVNCQQPFVFSFVSFEVLPVVEFVVETDISDEEAEMLIETEPSPLPVNAALPLGEEAGAQTLTLDDGKETNDPFTERLLSFEMGSSSYTPVVVDRHVLRSLHRNQVFVKKFGQPIGNQYFYNVLSDVPISMCPNCFQMFHSDDFELQVLIRKCCPFCRHPNAV